MSIQKFLTTEKLVEYLDKEVKNLLISQDIFDIGSYGWQSEDTEDPNYIGHAMWQVDPPLETDWDYLYGDCPPRRNPSENEKLLVVVGNDFEGLMRASRLSIGLCLLHKKIALKNPINDNHYFWLHHTDSILQLNMASDRIREYFTLAFFDVTSDIYKQNGRKNGWYVTPFIEAIEHCKKYQTNTKIIDPVSLLPHMAERIYSFREIRNGIVHDIATKLGKMNKEFAEMHQADFDSKKLLKSTKDIPDYDTMIKKQKEIQQKHEMELSKSSLKIIDWYKILVKFSSHIFEAEHWLRKCKICI